MQVREGQLGRIFVLRLEDGDRIPEMIEQFALDRNIDNAMLIFLGGVADGSRVVVGPEAGHGDRIVPQLFTLRGHQEIAGVGTLFRNQEGRPVLHLHAAAGRDGNATVGCTRAGVKVWLVGEAVLLEIQGDIGRRLQAPQTDLELLELSQSS